MVSSEEDEVVWRTILSSLKDPDFRRWRIETYGRHVFMDDGRVFDIQDDGRLKLIVVPFKTREERSS